MMSLPTRTLPRLITVGGILGITGFGVYYMTQITRAQAESNEPKKVFSGFGFTSLRLHSTQTINHNTKRLVFEFPDPEACSGLSLTSALLTLTRPKGRWLPVLRPYTPISDLDEPGRIELMVKQYPNGKASGHIHSLQPGDSMTFVTALRGFPWKQNQFPHVYLLAGGAGITPIYQLIRGIFKNPDDRTKVTLVFGVNTEEDLLLREELEYYAKQFPGRFNYLYTISHPKEEATTIRKGYIDESLLRGVFKESLADTKVFVCGPPAMESALVGSRGSPGILSQLGLKKDQIYKF